MHSKFIFLLIFLSTATVPFARQAHAQEAAALAVRQLWSDSDHARQAAKRTLLELGPKAIPHLIEQLKSLSLDNRPRFPTGKEQEGQLLLERFLDLSPEDQSEHTDNFQALNRINIRRRLEDDTIELLLQLKPEDVLPPLLDLLCWEGLEIASHQALLTRSWTTSMEGLVRIGSPAVGGLIKVIEGAKGKAISSANQKGVQSSELEIKTLTQNIQERAVRVLGRIGDGSVLPLLLNLECYNHGRMCQALEEAVNAILRKDPKNSGLTYQQLKPVSDREAFQEVEYIDENYGWAASDHSLWRTTDGGKSWAAIRKAATRRVSSVGEPYREGQGFIERIQVLDRNEGWILEDSALLHTTNGGASWKKYDPEDIGFNGFRFLDKYRGWSVAARNIYPDNEPSTWTGEIYGTTDGGTTWRKVSVEIPLDRTRLLDISIASPDNIWVVGDIIFNSRDKGKTWKEVDLPGGDGFYGRPSRIEFINSDVGWIIADGYLVTRDGGRSWSARSREEGIEDLMRLKRRGSIKQRR
jgi:photosystem II stability/assembly factor-like uncharacterized protein